MGKEDQRKSQAKMVRFDLPNMEASTPAVGDPSLAKSKKKRVPRTCTHFGSSLLIHRVAWPGEAQRLVLFMLLYSQPPPCTEGTGSRSAYRSGRDSNGH